MPVEAEQQSQGRLAFWGAIAWVLKQRLPPPDRPTYRAPAKTVQQPLTLLLDNTYC